MTATAGPFPTVVEWLREAEQLGRRNPLATALATVGRDGRPAVRMVLLKSVDAERGHFVFYTNYRSRKAEELEACPWAAAVLYWEELGRQIRFEGRVERSPAAESDAYFATRPQRSQLNAWVSAQSRVLDADGDLERVAAEKARELWPPDGALSGSPASAPRPPFWGGYRLCCDGVELWTEGAGRFHERVRYFRTLTFAAEGEPSGGAWQRERLQP